MASQLNLKGVNKYYGKLHALKNINLVVEEGEFLGILGESGSGKSTLLNVISGLDTLDSGEITINGITTRDFSKKEWAIYRNHYIGFVFQEYNLVDHLTVVENVELPLLLQGTDPSVARERALQKCKILGLSKHVHKLPKKISGGQQQRAAIARALVTEPKVILADEPTGALDSENARIILDILKVLSKDHIVILVTHDEEFAEAYSTRLIRLEDGVIVSDSNTKKIGYESTSQLDLKRPNMRLKVLWKFAYNNLKKRLVRTFFTSLTMSLGLIAIFLIIFLVNGIRTEVTDVIKEIIPEDQYYITSEMNHANITDEEYDFVVAQSIVSEAYFDTTLIPLTNQLIEYYKDGEEYYQVANYSIRSIPLNERNFIYRNNLIGNYPQDENEVIITSGLASELVGSSINENELDRALDYIKQNEKLTIVRLSSETLLNEDFDVVGIIYNKQPVSYALHTKVDELKQQITEEDIQWYYGAPLEDRSNLTVYLSTDNEDRIEDFEDLLFENGLILNNPVKIIFSTIDDFFDTILYILVGTASISLLVSGILVGLMIYISVLERIKEIGILTSIGARSSNIRNLFIFESGFLGFLSSFIALFISLFFTWMINAIFNRTIGNLFRVLNMNIFDQFKLLHVDIIAILVVFGLSIIYSILCGLIPAYKASRLNAIEALRKE